jgi:hypothetical protein
VVALQTPRRTRGFGRPLFAGLGRVHGMRSEQGGMLPRANPRRGLPGRPRLLLGKCEGVKRRRAPPLPPSPCGSGGRARWERVAFRRFTAAFLSPAPCFRATTEVLASLIQAASAALRARHVQPLRAAGHNAGGRLGRGLPSAGSQLPPASAAATPRFAVSCRTPLARAGW